MKRRGNGEGSIYQRKDGRWQVSIRINGTRRTAYGKTEREAYKKLREMRREVDTTPSLPGYGRKTVAELVDAWLEAATLKSSTEAQYRRFFDTYVLPTLANTRLGSVTPEKLQRLYAGLTPSVGAHVHTLLHRAFAVAVLWGWLPSNPCDRVLKPAHRAKRRDVWSSHEMARFIQATSGEWLHPLWLFLLGTGCRIGEALALAWGEVDVERATVAITRTLHRINGEWIFEAAKTANSERTIVLPDFAAEALRAQERQQARWREAVGERLETRGLVFTGETGAPLDKSTVQHALERWCKRLDLPHMTSHGLRHLHASLLLDRGVPITAVSARLGHASPDITMKIYAHALKGQDDQAARAIGEVISLRDDEEDAEEGETDDEET